MSDMTVGDLTDEHYGWYIRVEEPPDAPLPAKYLTLGRTRGRNGSGIRRWTYEGVERIGLLDVDDTHGGTVVGTERHYEASRPCELIRQVKKYARSTAPAGGAS